MIKKLAMLILFVASIAMPATASAQSLSVGRLWPTNQLAPIDQVDHLSLIHI